MTTFTLYVLIAILLAFALGLCVGRATSDRRRTSDTSNATFSDPDVAAEAGEKGRAAIAARIKKRKDRIMERAKREGKVTNDDVEDLFCISDSTAHNYLSELEAEGRLTQVGETGRGVYYTPTK